MTPATIVQVFWTTRRGWLMVIAALMLLTGALVYQVAVGMERPEVVKYGSQVITPDVALLCPGDVLSYEQRFVVEEHELPVVLHVVEAWRSVETGLTLRHTASEYRLPLIVPTDLRADVTRPVPDLPPGVYWFDHVATNGRTTAYTVGPVTIGDAFFCDQ